MNEPKTLEQRALELLENGPTPLPILASLLDVGQRTLASRLVRARAAGDVERTILTERWKTRKGSFKPGTHVYRLPQPDTEQKDPT